MSSPKRLRQTGSFSPLSPPYYQGAKVDKRTFSPQTPTSPPLSRTPMTSVQNYAPSHSSITSNSQPHTVASTPASSVHGPSQNTRQGLDDDGDIEMSGITSHAMAGKQQVDSPIIPVDAPADVVMQENNDHRRTDHDRDSKRYAEKEGSQVKPPAGDGQFFYKICQYPHPPQLPHPSQDLLALYGLGDLYMSLRRWQPDQVTKDVKLRKSYGGYLKTLKIAGRNEALEQPETFTPRLTDYPAEEWHAQNVSGRPIELTADLESKIQAAMQMNRGALPRPQAVQKVKDKDDLGDKDVILKVRHLLDPGDKKKEVKIVAPQVANAQQARPVATNSPVQGAQRPNRLNKKRSYHDDSFVGYGSGFESEDPLSTAEDGGSAFKKRKKF